MGSPFKAYDVRGIYGKDITEDLAYKIGRAFVDFTGAKNVVVGHDMRPSSIPLSENMINGMRDQGANVTMIGLSSTDMFYFSVISMQSDGGIVVTASHNPGEYNGFKFTREKAIPIGIESGLAEIEKIILNNSFKPKADKQGSLTHKEMLNEFIKFMHSFVNPKSLKKLKAVIDCGNGMGGMIMPKLFEGSPLEIIPMYYELDGTFPNHEANPLLEENRVDLIKKVKETGADIGIGMDGDTDRAFFVDGDGNFCSGDFILGLMTKEVLKLKPGSTIVYDVRCSNYVKDTVTKCGGKYKMWKVGHAYAKTIMREIGAEFGGEVSGHYYFKHHDAYFDSGNLTVLILLKVLSDGGMSLKEALKETNNYHISGEINSKVKDPDAKISEIKKLYEGKGEVVEIDGLSVISDKWWFNIRKSNTEPLLRLNCEADTKANLETLRDKLLGIIRS